MTGIKTQLITDSRHKLFFIPESDEIKFVDIGRELSSLLQSYVANKNISLIADELVDKIINQHLTHDSVIGEYIALKNIGILFEPELKLSLETKLDSWAKSFVLLIKNNEGVIKDNRFYLAGTMDDRYSINLKEISHKSINHEI